MAINKSTPQPFSAEHVQGRKLAIRMRQEYEDAADEASIEAGFRDGKPQCVAPFLSCLQVLRAANSRELDGGFAAVLSDFLSMCLNGAVPQPDFYEPFLDFAYVSDAARACMKDADGAAHT